MIYFLKQHGSDRVSVRYYRTRGSYQKVADELGMEVLRIEQGGKEKIYDIRDRFRPYISMLGSSFILSGKLQFYLEIPHPLERKGIARIFAMTLDDVKDAARSLGMGRQATFSMDDARRIEARYRMVEESHIMTNREVTVV